MRWLLGAVWIGVVAVSVALETETTEQVVSLDSAAKLYNGIPKEDLPPLTLQGIRSMDLWDNANNDAIRQNNKLIKRLDTPWKTKMSKNCCKYHRIPWFKLGFMGKKFSKKSKSDCQSLCNKYIACNSFSYNFEEKECIWSPQSVTYDQDWRFYSKKHNSKGAPDGTYHMFPGMKFLEPFTDVEKEKSLQECEYSCTQELGCSSFSYSEPRAECARSGQSIGYSEHWQYFEKSARPKPVWEEKHEKENEEKDKIKKDYINDISRTRKKEKKTQKKEAKRKVDIETQVKKDSRETEAESKRLKRAKDKKEREKKTAEKVKENDKKFGMKMQQTMLKIDEIEKNKMEILQKRIVDEKDSAGKAQLRAKKKELKGELDVLKKKYDTERLKEQGVKDDFRKKDLEAGKADEKAGKEEQKKRSDKFKLQMAEEGARLEAKEKASKDCKVSQKDANERVAEAKRTEKASKTKLANEEGMVAKWTQRTKMATNENHKKRYDEFLSESKESLKKTTADEQRFVKTEMDATRKAKHVKEKCAKKAKKKKDAEKKMKKEEAEMEEKKKAAEELQKRQIKEGAHKVSESDVKENGEKENGLKEGNYKSKKERADKESNNKEQTLKEKKKKIEVKEKETNSKEVKHKKMVKEAEKKELQIKESTKKAKAKEELEFKEKYFKESKAKESAAKDSAHMTKEVNDKEKEKARDREEQAAAQESEANKKVLEAKDEKSSKLEREKLSKAEENTIKAKMQRPRLEMVRRNDAGVIKVPAPGGTIMVGGGIINHYRKWNGNSIFEESYPDGDTWRCDTGVGNKGQATCISLSYKLPEGTKCINARVYTANAGVIHATLPPGYLMVSGGVQNLHRRFDRHAAFEESMPSGDRKWRCDMGYGRGELNCFVRGCKFPHGAHCVTTEGSSDNAGWVWAECPEGYQVFGCGMRNNYLNFDVRSGFEDLRPIGNKCMGDMGFGAGQVSVYARCCKVTGPPPEIPAPVPPPAPGKANPDDVKCMAETRWEMKKHSTCTGGDLDVIPVKAGSPHKLGEQMEACAFKCAQQERCTGFSFPTPSSVSKMECKLKGDKEHVFSEELQQFCETEAPSDDWNSFAKLSGSCSGKSVKLTGIVVADRRRRQDLSRRRAPAGRRLGEDSGDVRILGNTKA